MHSTSDEKFASFSILCQILQMTLTTASTTQCMNDKLQVQITHSKHFFQLCKRSTRLTYIDVTLVENTPSVKLRKSLPLILLKSKKKEDWTRSVKMRK